VETPPTVAPADTDVPLDTDDAVDPVETFTLVDPGLTDT